MAQADADRNLLFGILAVQMDFISRDALIGAMNAWVLDKQKPLAQILVNQGALAQDEHALLESLIRKHLERHGDDPLRSLNALSVVGSVRQDLELVADPDVQASLAHIAVGSPATSLAASSRPTVTDPHETRAEPPLTLADPSATRAPADPYEIRVEPPAATADPFETKAEGLESKATGGGESASRGPALGETSSHRVRFRALRKHAQGGLGEVFIAHDEELDREVALKEIKGRYADHPESRSRFEFEAEVTGGLEHPGVVPVYGLGRHPDGRPYYAMRFIRGESLKEAIARHQQTAAEGRDPGERHLELQKLLRRFIDVCNAMEYAHSRHVLHRDLKPDNVMLGPYGETLIVDWGLAKPLDRPDLASDLELKPLRPASGDSVTVTQAGSTIGTPAYMPPEQAAGRLDQMSPSSDIYSLGATLYHLLTGRAPFVDRDLATVLHKVQQGEFPPPREVKGEVHPALQAICLKAMARRPEDRYPSARALADDLEHWLADEPVSAWREPWTVRARRWMARHRTLVTSAAAALLVGLAAGGYLLYEARLRAVQRLTRAEGLVTALTTAATREVPRILEPLAPDRPLVRSRLRALADDPRGAPRGRLHAALALLPDEPARADALAQAMIDAETSPEVLIVIRQALNNHSRTLTPRLWAALERKDDRQALSSQQLRAAAALAAFDPDDARWETLRGPVAARLVQENPLLIGAWREAFQGVGGRLAEPLRAIYADRTGSEPRALAFSLLFDYANRGENPNRSEDLAELIADADPEPFERILAAIPDRTRAIARLAPKLDHPARFDEAEAQRQGRVALALARLGAAERVWPVLRQGDDPSVRTELIHTWATFQVEPTLLIERLKVEPDTAARRTLLLSLGEFPPDRILAAERLALVPTLLHWYRADPDPGVHGGLDWLLRQKWGQAEELDRIDRELAGPDLPKDRDWYINGQGQTFAVVRGPVEFQMGSPATEVGRLANEVRHLRRIDRSFAIATREVTVAQYRRFLEQNPDVANDLEDEEIKPLVPSPDCPMIGVDWYDAARYCNWLSRQEGIPEDQGCYPQEIKEGMTLSADGLKRAGYRLPTEAEWECACRSGSLASRPYGSNSSLGMLGQYGWFVDNAGGILHPVSQKKPNDFGLFDILGNVDEWTQNRYGPYRPSHDGEASTDAMVDTFISDGMTLVLRGGAFDDSATSLRASLRYTFRPSYRYLDDGFRVSRTYP